MIRAKSAAGHTCLPGYLGLTRSPKIEGVPKEPEDDIFLDGEGGLKALVQVRNAIVSSLAAIEKELKTPA